MGKARREDKNKIFKIIVIALLIVFLLVGAFAGLMIWEEYNGKSDTGVQYLEYDGKKYTLKTDGVEACLIMGLDKYDGDASAESYNNDQQADFLMLIVFDNYAKKYSTIHINRDTMTEMKKFGPGDKEIGTITNQVALAHSYGSGGTVSGHNTVNAVKNILFNKEQGHYSSPKINFISFKMDSVAIVNDMVGGVEVEVLDDFTGVDETLVKGQKVTLNGEQALHYVRTRKGLEDSSNITRMQRQRQYLKSLRGEMVTAIQNDVNFAANVVTQMEGYYSTDYNNVTALSDLAKKLSEYEFVGINDIEGENKMGDKFIEFYPDEKSVKDVVVSLFYEQAK